LATDPELKYSSNGESSWCRFSVPINDHYGGNETTTWYRVVCFGKTAENVNQYMRKGSPVAIEGRVEIDSWTGKDGKTRNDLKLVARDVRFIRSGEAPAQGRASGVVRSERQAPPRTSGGRDDIPF